jgi:quercetin dioxygenase-like cupin family protein
MGKKNEKIVQTAGRNQLSDIAPMFAHLNDDVLFGEVWNEEAISTKLKCILTVTALMSSGITDSSLQYHLQNAKNNGVSKREIAAIITHVTMYTGWPKGWAVFRLAMEIWGKDEPATSKEAFEKSASFPVGPENVNFNKWFTGTSYLQPISTEGVGIFNVTFEPGCRNFWHIHHADKGGGQILVCVDGHGFYQEWGKEPVEMYPGDCVNIPVGVKHWHGAAADSWFSHLSIEVPGENGSSEWLEPVSDEQYAEANK